jgi:hypothetical protein
MFNLELSRAVELDRRREIDAHLEHRRAIHDQARGSRPADPRGSSPRTAGQPDAALRPSR